MAVKGALTKSLRFRSSDAKRTIAKTIRLENNQTAKSVTDAG
jgi:hypothetical protein